MANASAQCPIGLQNDDWLKIETEPCGLKSREHFFLCIIEIVVLALFFLRLGYLLYYCMPKVKWCLIYYTLCPLSGIPVCVSGLYLFLHHTDFATSHWGTAYVYFWWWLVQFFLYMGASHRQLLFVEVIMISKQLKGFTGTGSYKVVLFSVVGGCNAVTFVAWVVVPLATADIPMVVSAVRIGCIVQAFLNVCIGFIVAINGKRMKKLLDEVLKGIMERGSKMVANEEIQTKIQKTQEKIHALKANSVVTGVASLGAAATNVYFALDPIDWVGVHINLFLGGLGMAAAFRFLNLLEKNEKYQEPQACKSLTVDSSPSPGNANWRAKFHLSAAKSLGVGSGSSNPGGSSGSASSTPGGSTSNPGGSRKDSRPLDRASNMRCSAPRVDDKMNGGLRLAVQSVSEESAVTKTANRYESPLAGLSCMIELETPVDKPPINRAKSDDSQASGKGTPRRSTAGSTAVTAGAAGAGGPPKVQRAQTASSYDAPPDGNNFDDDDNDDDDAREVSISVNISGTRQFHDHDEAHDQQGHENFHFSPKRMDKSNSVIASASDLQAAKKLGGFASSRATSTASVKSLKATLSVPGVDGDAHHANDEEDGVAPRRSSFDSIHSLEPQEPHH